ncbi:MAG TPA: hypothetical protein VEC60_05090, partial [Reyranella sp.]|nr:hypothetical protein [Reyranella sp.]
MDGELVLLGLIALGWAVGTPIIAILALVRASKLREQNARLAAEVSFLSRQVEQVVVSVLPPPRPQPEPEPAPPAP